MKGLHYHYQVPGDDFTRAGEASGATKATLKKLGFPPQVVRKVAIAMYEGEINLVIHGGGGEIDVDIDGEKVQMVLTDHGPGIPDIQKAMNERTASPGGGGTRIPGSASWPPPAR